MDDIGMSPDYRSGIEDNVTCAICQRKWLDEYIVTCEYCRKEVCPDCSVTDLWGDSVCILCQREAGNGQGDEG